MSHPLYWPGVYYFYPIGNTSAVCLTRDLPPEVNADILLLGCGDPRSILYTVFCEPEHSQRRLDFTACDFDPAVLARNIILLTMFRTEDIDIEVIWNFFFHAYLDDQTQSKLTEHCNKLIEASTSTLSWHASCYGSYLRMCNEQTLIDIRRHWQLYVDFPNLTPQRLSTVRDAFRRRFTESKTLDVVWNMGRSAGPLFSAALLVSAEQFNVWNKTGLTYSDNKRVKNAKHINPTFAYSLGGEGCNVHYGTDPLVPFHYAPLFGNTKAVVTMNMAINAAKEEFTTWRTAFQRIQSTLSQLTIRFFSGEATALCRGLKTYTTSHSLDTGIPMAQWRSHTLAFEKEEYVNRSAPTSFQVIDTSNLVDHIGLLNVLVSTVPLLSASLLCIIYTESLLYESTDATKEFSTQLHGDMATIGLLIGLHPIDYLSGFTSNSHTHEILMLSIVQDFSKQSRSQYRQCITWKPATTTAGFYPEQALPQFDPYQLASFLYDMYHSLFEGEDSSTWFKKHLGPAREKHDILKAIGRGNIVHYVRETFVLFLKLVHERLCFTNIVWNEIMYRFYTLVDNDETMPMDTVNRNDLWTQLHRHGLYTAPWQVNSPLQNQYLRKEGRFASWESVPALVRVFLVTPKEKLSVFEEGDGTPLLHCDIAGNQMHNVFSSVHVAYGTITMAGTKSNPRVLFNEDPKGQHGSSPLIASFVISTAVVNSFEPQSQLTVNLGVRSTASTFKMTKKLGLRMRVFSAKFLDKSQVFVLPEKPETLVPSLLPVQIPAGLCQIGTLDRVLVQLDEEFEMATTFSRKLLVENATAKRLFGEERVVPLITQTTSHIMRVTVGKLQQDILFPFPVIGSKVKSRLARTSLYIEVIVPIFEPFKPDGMKLNSFPVVGTSNSTFAWNIHRVNLKSLPSLNLRIPKATLDKWLGPHVGSQMSSRERKLRKTHEDDGIMLVKDTLHTIFVRSAGIQRDGIKRLFALRDFESKKCDTIIFVSDIKYDVGSHTVVCDGYVLPLTDAVMDKIHMIFGTLVTSGIVNISVYKSEMKAWKHLLPSLVERCRSWEHTTKCEYTAQKRIPLAIDMDDDPLCSCGRGKDVSGMTKDKLWSPFAPHVTRIALSPLFAVSYLERVGRDLEMKRCRVCRKRAQPNSKLKACSACQKVRYCSPKCQKDDWKAHKLVCKA